MKALLELKTLLTRDFLIKLAILTVCIGVLYASVIRWLVYDWIHMPDFSHGFLIPLVSLYFIYDRRDRLAEIMPEGHWTGLIWIAAGVLLLLLGNLATEYFTMRFSLIVVLAGVVIYLLGKQYFRELMLPLGYLIFMIPVPSILLTKLTFPMQLFASKVSAALLELVGIPVLREGNVIQLANTSLEVAEACSGIRYLISLVALAVVFAYLTQRIRWKQVVIVLSAFPIAVIANVLRVGGTAFLAHYFGSGVAQGFFHDFSGLLVFSVAFICMFGVGYLLSLVHKGA